jgi:arginyl-tRNA synthetase
LQNADGKMLLKNIQKEYLNLEQIASSGNTIQQQNSFFRILSYIRHMQQLINIITSHITSLYGDTGFVLSLSAPPKAEHGEYCFGVFTLAKPTLKNPSIIAEEVANVLKGDTTHFKSINTIGGYVNITCTSRVWSDIIATVTNPEIVKPGSGETIVVDYIGANTGKPLHIGHICTPSVGQSICNIHNYLGYKVIGDSHFGDWGGVP